MDVWEGGHVVAADPWPLSCSLKHGGFGQRKKMRSSSIRATPSSRARTCEHIGQVREGKIDLLAQTKPGFSSEQWRNGHAIWREAVAEHWRKAIVRQRFVESSHVCVRLADMMSDELSLLLQCFTLGLITWSNFYSPVSVYLTLYVAHAHLILTCRLHLMLFKAQLKSSLTIFKTIIV